MNDLNKVGLVEMNEKELKEKGGGFVPLVILGVTYSAATVAKAAGALFIAGMGAGVAAAAATD